MTASPTKRTHFINVDLDLKGPVSLRPFIEHWGDDVFALRHEGSDELGWKAGLELSHADRTAEEAIVEFVALVEALPEELRKAWDALGVRNLDVGIQAGAEPGSWSFSLEPATLASLDAIGARLVCTVYPSTEGTSTALPRQT